MLVPAHANAPKNARFVAAVRMKRCLRVVSLVRAHPSAIAKIYAPTQIVVVARMK